MESKRKRERKSGEATIYKWVQKVLVDSTELLEEAGGVIPSEESHPASSIQN